MSKMDTFAELMKQIIEMLSKRANRMMKKNDLTFTQMMVLKMLMDEEDHTLSQGKITQGLMVSQPTVAGVIKRMHKKDFIRILPDSSDGRIKIIQLADRGRDCYQATEEKRQEMADIFWSAFTTEERDIFIALLAKLRDSLAETEEKDS
ncbi:MAG: MarR family transcriptional regulator [Eubacterium sp.]|nr:MarR family transcriptional regulator [Eubacterium sp.]MBR1633595.1 MarR family transcriptional regulator [Lachnospiraceae bacterium]